MESTSQIGEPGRAHATDVHIAVDREGNVTRVARPRRLEGVAAVVPSYGQPPRMRPVATGHVQGRARPAAPIEDESPVRRRKRLHVAAPAAIRRPTESQLPLMSTTRRV